MDGSISRHVMVNEGPNEDYIDELKIMTMVLLMSMRLMEKANCFLVLYCSEF